MTGHRLRWQTNSQGCNCWFSSQEFVTICLHGIQCEKEVQANWKTFGKKEFCTVFDSENILLFLSLNKIHATKYIQGYWVYIKCFILTLFPFSFIWVQISRTWNFVTKIFLYRSFPIITGHGTKNVLLMKFEILGLEIA